MVVLFSPTYFWHGLEKALQRDDTKGLQSICVVFSTNKLTRWGHGREFLSSRSFVEEWNLKKYCPLEMQMHLTYFPMCKHMVRVRAEILNLFDSKVPLCPRPFSKGPLSKLTCGTSVVLMQSYSFSVQILLWATVQKFRASKIFILF